MGDRSVPLFEAKLENIAENSLRIRQSGRVPRNIGYRKNAAKERRTHTKKNEKGSLGRRIGLVVHPNGALYDGGM